VLKEKREIKASFIDKQFSSPEHFISLGLNRVYWDLYNT